MKKNFKTRLAAATALTGMLLASRAGATITSIVANPADYTCRVTANVNNPIASTTDAIGAAGSPTVSWCAILMFPLPTLPAGKTIGDQTALTITLASVGASTSFNADVWGVANFRNTLPTGTPDATYYYYLGADAGPGTNATLTDVKLVDNFLTPARIGSAAGTVVSTVAGSPNSLQTYINSFYTNNPTYDASVSPTYVWLRINLDGNSVSTANRYVINAGDTGVSSTLRPTLKLDIIDIPSSVPLVWNGDVSALWDINTTANWKTNTTSGLLYQDGSGVIFNDALTAHPTITLNSTVAPASVTLNNGTTPYLITGTGKITGATTVTKSGSGTAILDTDNDYTGLTTLASGTLQLGNGDAHGAVGTNVIAVSGVSTLALNRTDAITLNSVYNSGSVPNLVVNSGTVSLAGVTDNIGAAANVNAGARLVLAKPSSGAVHALGTSSTINAGGTLQLGGTGGDQIYQNVVITNNGTFDLAGLSEGFNGLTGGGAVTNTVATAATLQLGDGNGSAVFNGVIANGAGSVAVTKAGTGTQVLNGINTYTGNTTMNAGKLVLTTASLNPGAYTVADAATLGVAVTAPNASLAVSTLTIGNSTLELQNINSATTAPLNAANLTINGTVTINLTGGSLVPGQSYPLVAYASLTGGPSFTLGTLPPGVFATLDTSVSPVKLVVTSVPLTWNGDVSDVWDIGGAPNWKAGAVTGLTYPDGEIVTLDDSLTGTAAISLDSVVSPAGLIFSNNAVSYTIGGGGYITGPLVLTKLGTNTVILDTDNDYYGGTVLAGGTLQVGNNDAHGSIGSGMFTNLVGGSILAFNRTDAITIGTITRTTVDNSARLVINSGTVTLGGVGDNSGAIATVNNGATLILAKDSSSAVHALSSFSPFLLINPGGLMQLGGFGNDQIYMSSGLTDNGTFDLAGHSEGFDMLAGNGLVTTSGGGVTLQLGENNGSSTFTGAIVDGSGSLAVTKTGTGTLTLNGASTYTGNTTINAGKLVASTAATGGGSYTTANATTLGVSVATANGTLNVNTLTLGSSGASALEFQNLNSTTTAAIQAASVVANGPVTINITGGTFAAGQNYPLLGYTSLSGGSFALGTLPAGMTATLAAGASPITLNVTGVLNVSPTNLVTAYVNGVLTLSWPADHTGWLLQSNSIDLGNPNDWFAVPGSTATNAVNIQPDPNAHQVFYRLSH